MTTVAGVAATGGSHVLFAVGFLLVGVVVGILGSITGVTGEGSVRAAGQLRFAITNL